MIDWVELGKLLLAGLAGGTIGPYLTNSRERRSARAAASEQVAQVEQLRWAGAEWDEFRRSLYAFEAKALAAGVSKGAVRLYQRLAQLARSTSDVQGERYGEDEASIGPELNNLVRDARDMVIDLCWHPWRTRLVLRRRLERVAKGVQELRESEEGKDVPWYNWDHPI